MRTAKFRGPNGALFDIDLDDQATARLAEKKVNAGEWVSMNQPPVEADAATTHRGRKAPSADD